ncbi:MAG: phosphate signaling complex protein PhoU [Candidatus Dormibacteria bacterium]
MTEEPVEVAPAGHRPALDAELSRIRAGVMEIGQLVGTALEKAVWGLREQNPDLCTAVIEGDAEVNDRHLAIREMCHTTILIQQPVARDLRYVLSYDRMSSELERMGDHCVSIARIARSLCDLPDEPSSESLGVLAAECRRQLLEMLNAVEAADLSAARQLAARDAVVDQQYRRIFETFVAGMGAGPGLASRATGLVFVAHYLERIGDRVTNIAEDLIFAETGGVEELG